MSGFTFKCYGITSFHILDLFDSVHAIPYESLNKRLALSKLVKKLTLATCHDMKVSRSFHLS